MNKKKEKNYFGPIAEHNLAGWGKLNWVLGERRADSSRRHIALPETDDRMWAGKSQACGEAQINRNG